MELGLWGFGEFGVCWCRVWGLGGLWFGVSGFRAYHEAESAFPLQSGASIDPVDVPMSLDDIGHLTIQ